MLNKIFESRTLGSEETIELYFQNESLRKWLMGLIIIDCTDQQIISDKDWVKVFSHTTVPQLIVSLKESLNPFKEHSLKHNKVLESSVYYLTLINVYVYRLFLKAWNFLVKVFKKN